jgi:hypothetical protein
MSREGVTYIVREGPGPMVAARWVAILRQQEARRVVILHLSVLTESPGPTRSEQK